MVQSCQMTKGAGAPLLTICSKGAKRVVTQMGSWWRSFLGRAGALSCRMWLFLLFLQGPCRARARGQIPPTPPPSSSPASASHLSSLEAGEKTLWGHLTRGLQVRDAGESWDVPSSIWDVPRSVWPGHERLMEKPGESWILDRRTLNILMGFPQPCTVRLGGIWMWRGQEPLQACPVKLAFCSVLEVCVGATVVSTAAFPCTLEDPGEVASRWGGLTDPSSPSLPVGGVGGAWPWPHAWAGQLHLSLGLRLAWAATALSLAVRAARM